MHSEYVNVCLLSLLFGLIYHCDSETIPECPQIISRTRWGARVALEVEYAIIPLQYVIMHHTVTDNCAEENECSNLLSDIQNFHVDTLGFHDIGYNFIVGGDGQIYEGAGWHKVGAHTYGYNSRSMGLALTGNFTAQLPNPQQLSAAKKLMECGVALKELDPRYKLLGARQVSSTQSPGLKLYHEIQSWPNFSHRP